MTRPSIVMSLFSLLLAIVSFVQAGDEPVNKAEPQKPVTQVIPVTIYPAATPTPALKYHLLTPFLERTPGNAALLYCKAILILEGDVNNRKRLDPVANWLTMPLNSLPRDEVRRTLDSFGSVLNQVEAAARREQCDWDAPLRQGNIISLLLPELQQARSIARLIALRARLQMAERDYTKAVASLQVGYGIARHFADEPLLISSLVGMMIVRMMDEQVLTLIQQPNAPNLYWSLAALPRPVIDL